MSNNQQGSRGTRIIVGWDMNRTNLMVLSQSDQVIHCVFIIVDNKSFFCSFVYAGNSHAHRKELWSNLCMHKLMVGNSPWVILGDFNVGLNIEDHSIGSSGITLGMREFKDCIDDLGVEDLNSTGLHFTWN